MTGLIAELKYAANLQVTASLVNLRSETGKQLREATLRKLFLLKRLEKEGSIEDIVDGEFSLMEIERVNSLTSVQQAQSLNAGLAQIEQAFGALVFLRNSPESYQSSSSSMFALRDRDKEGAT